MFVRSFNTIFFRPVSIIEVRQKIKLYRFSHACFADAELVAGKSTVLPLNTQ